MSKMIQVEHLQKDFRVIQRSEGRLAVLRDFIHPMVKTIRAVDNVSFSMERGELVGYMGPNGAGKSTTIKMLTGLLVPTAGSVWVDGMIPWKNRTAYVKKIGAVFGQRTGLWWDLPVIDSLELLQTLYDVPADRFRSNLDDFRRILGLDEFIQSPARSLSLGQRMRAELCAALLHEPTLLFLDEPTIGLDVVAKDRIRQFIRYINQQRETTIILTTHDLSDVERLCSRVIILDHGQILYDGGLDSLVERFEGNHLLTITFRSSIPVEALEDLPVLSRNGQHVTYSFNHRKFSLANILSRMQENYEIEDVQVRRPDIEDTVRRIYEERLLR